MVGGEISEEPRMGPVSQPGIDQSVKIGSNPLERLGRLGRRRRKPSPNLARLDRRDDPFPPDVTEIVGHPVNQPVPLTTKFFPIHQSSPFPSSHFVSSVRRRSASLAPRAMVSAIRSGLV